TASAPKRVRTDSSIDLKAGRQSDTLAMELVDLINKRFTEQNEHISSSLGKAEERILAELELRFSQKINKLSEEVIDLRSQRDRLDEKVGQLDREVAALRALCGKVAQLESKLASQQEHNRAYEMRIHGVPYGEGENVRALFHTLCFNLQLTPPPRIRDIFRARKTQNTHVDPVIIVK
ncbi:hypothetical protein KR059_012945, partial [Drosophila kikkawai]